MIKIPLPGKAAITIQHLVLDFNGTLAVDGAPLPGVKEKLAGLAEVVSIHIITADTHGTAREAMAWLPLEQQCLPTRGESHFVTAEKVEDSPRGVPPSHRRRHTVRQRRHHSPIRLQTLVRGLFPRDRERTNSETFESGGRTAVNGSRTANRRRNGQEA